MNHQQPSPHPLIKNPQIPGEAFFWEGGSIGALLIHGYTATTAEVRLLAQALHAEGYTISAPVIPGHNTFPEEINQFTWRDWVATMEQAYQELAARCEHVFVGGESTGGLLALNLAADHPEISGVLIYAPALKLTMSPLNQIIMRLMAPLIPYIHRGGEDDGLPWRGYTVIPLKGGVQLLKFQKHMLPRLPQIHQPMLIVQGRLDDTVDPNVPETIYNGVSSTLKEIHWMENSRHVVAIDHEHKEVEALTLAFMQKALP